MPQKVVTNLWFDTEAEEAAKLNTSVFPSSGIVSVTPYPDLAALRAAADGVPA